MDLKESHFSRYFPENCFLIFLFFFLISMFIIFWLKYFDFWSWLGNKNQSISQISEMIKWSYSYRQKSSWIWGLIFFLYLVVVWHHHEDDFLRFPTIFTLSSGQWWSATLPESIISSSFCCFLLTIKNQDYGVRFSFTSLISSWYHFKAVCCMIIQQLPSYSSLSLGLRRTTSNSWGSWYEFGYHIIPNSCIIIAENYSLLPNLVHFEHSECRQHYWAQFQLGKPFKKTKFAFKIGISWFAA